MKQRTALFYFFCASIWLAVGPTASRAQLVNDGATNTLANVTNSIIGNVTIGTNGSFTLLTLANNTLLTNSLNGTIGLNATAKSNEVRLVSPTARWRMGNNLFIGSNGASSRLVISNGALVEDFDAVLGNGLASSNNLGLVTGGGAVWSNRGDMTVGFSGRGNQLIVSNGGRVANRWGYLGRQPGSSNNIARITGAGSVWTNQFDVNVGFNDRSNQLIIEAGGFVTCANGVVSGSSSSGNNEVLVTGSGSVWSNRFFLFFGDVAGRNRFVVSNGATVWSGGSIVGTLSPAISNHVIVTGSGSMWTNESSLSLGESSSGNRVEVSDGGRLACVDGFIGLNAGANNNTVLLTGSGSAWNNLANLMVGNNGSGNVLIASNGASVFSEIGGVIGFNSTAISNTAIVTDPGSRLMGGVQSDFYIGSNSPFNRLIITNGGMVAGNGGYLGHEVAGQSNLVLVTGAGSLWSNRSSILEMGQRGSGNRLVITNGGAVYASFFRIGRITTGGSNEVLVTGPGSSLEVSFSSLRIGEGGSGNRVEINNGASVRSQFGEIGADSGSNNEALVTGPGSLWTNSGSFVIGRYGNRGRLIVTNGATLLSGGGMLIGDQTIATNNRVIVDGGTLRAANPAGNAVLEVRRGTNLFNAGLMDVDQLLMTNTLGRFEFNGGTLITRGAFVRNGDNFFIGAAGTNRAVWDVRAGVTNTYINDVIRIGSGSSFNQLILTNGAWLTNSESADLGTSLGANSNSAVIAGVGSQWLLGDGIIVGRAGSGNRLMASNGAAVVTASISYLGFQTASSNNEAEVTGPGTSWNSSAIYGLRVGYQGHHNRLRITDGALVTSGLSIIGEFATSSNNLAVVAGAGSVWSNTDSLFIGSAGVGNQLVVSNGATVFGYEGIIGYTAAGSNNAALVTDAGSTWSNSVDLFVGNDGRNCQLVVSNGGIVRGLYGTVGLNASSSNNLALVTGVGSMWSNTFDLVVGGDGRGNQLSADNGARLVNSNGIVGSSATSIGNLVLITGPGTVWSNRNSLHIGQFSPSNQVLVTAGGRVEANDVDIGFNASSSNNQVTVTGPGSFLQIQNTLIVGNQGAGGRLVISDGAGLHDDNALLGYFATNNEVVVTGTGTTWTNRSGVYVGRFRGGNRLTISNAALVVSRDVSIGTDVLATNNRVVVDGGTLLVTAVPGFGAFGALDVQRGTNVLNSGLIDIMRLSVANPLGQFEFNGGKLVSSETINNNGRLFTIGNGVSAATFELRGGLHTFANNLVVASNAVLAGIGTITGNLSVLPGGKIAPGTSIGRIILSNSPVLQGAAIMEISKTGSTLTNDQLQVAGGLVYGGSLLVTNSGATALAAGDRFPLFSASSYSGSFTNLVLPPLPVTLLWTNKLAVDGSIEIVPYVPPPVALTIQLSNGVLQVSWPTNGADYCLETSYDLAPPMTWRTVSSGISTNGASFLFSIANVSGAPKQFFRLAFPCSETPLFLSLQLSNNLVTVSWPSNQFRLETTFSLTPPITWQPLSNGITDTDGQRVLTIPNNPSVTNQFFRLANP